MKLQGATLQEAVNTLQKLRSYQPFRFGGAWYIAECSDGFHAFRTLCKKARESKNLYKTN